VIYLLSEKVLYLWAIILIKTVMALEIKSPPVLEGKAATDFYKTWAQSKESRSKEEIKALVDKWKRFFADQDQLHTSSRQ
jgi:hypothetical protein